MRRLVLILATTSLALAAPAAADAHHHRAHGLSVARGRQAIERQLPGYPASHCHAEHGEVLCTVTGPWEEEGGGNSGWTFTGTATAYRRHSRIYVIVDGFEGETSEHA